MRLPLRYLCGSFLARFAEEGMGVTTALLAFQRTGSVGQAAVVTAAWLAPHVLAAPAIGALAGRTRSPARFFAACLAGVAIAMGAVTLLLGRSPLWLVCGVAVAGGCCGPAVSGGLSSLVAELLPQRHRDRGYAWDSAMYNAASIAGVAAASAVAALWNAQLAGLLLTGSAAAATVGIGLLAPGGWARVAMPAAVVGRAEPTAADGGMSSTSVATTSHDDRTDAPPNRASPRSDLTVGLRALWRDRILRVVTAATCLAYLGIGGLTITAVLAARHWGDGEGGGALLTAFALGALTGAVALTRWTPPVPPQRLAAYCLAVTGVALGLAAVAPNIVVGLILFAIAGAGDGPLLSATLRVRAARAPRRARAQVFTTGAALKLSAAALGAGFAGAFESLPPALPLAVIAATQLAASLLVWTMARSTAEPVPA